MDTMCLPLHATTDLGFIVLTEPQEDAED